MTTPHNDLISFLKKSFTVILKDHQSAPPVAGLVWDAVKHRWVNPKNYGKSVQETGGKRFRASGAGQKGQQSVGGKGKGVARKFTEGRRFRETNYPPFAAPKPKGGRSARAKRLKTQRRKHG
jgi:hypothetical protein|tara:strand:- start:1655 stop:2020 length:366 start_codon:yes stop_codon:yes gene_type:complete